MDFVALNCTCVGVYAGELDVFAEVVPAVVAEKAGLAGHAGFYGHSVAFLLAFSFHE